jgi:hypothetical protein
MRALLFWFALTIVAWSVEARADGSLPEFAAGGLVVHDAADIATERQDLVISPGRVRVSYVYRSDAKTAQEATLAFPMPPVPVEGGPNYLGGGEINEQDPRNYMHFTVLVNGKPVEPHLHDYAYVGLEDVGSALQAAGLPLLMSYEEASSRIAALSGEQFFALEEKGIVSRSGDDPPYFAPLWRYQAVYEWRQSFPTGETRIEIAYRPLTSSPVDFGDNFETGETATAYCVDEALRAEIAARKAKGERYEVATLGFLLTTAPYWKDSIGTFSLTVDGGGTEEASLVAFCPPAEGRPSYVEGTWRWQMKDFAPARNLAVVFYYFR